MAARTRALQSAAAFVRPKRRRRPNPSLSIPSNRPFKLRRWIGRTGGIPSEQKGRKGLEMGVSSLLQGTIEKCEYVWIFRRFFDGSCEGRTEDRPPKIRRESHARVPYPFRPSHRSNGGRFVVERGPWTCRDVFPRPRASHHPT